jgi:hypothetical protein
MAHMHKETYSGVYYEVETKRDGTFFVPEDVCGVIDIEFGAMLECVDDIHEGKDWDTWQDVESALRDYVPSDIIGVSKLKGKLYRLSAPGYLDCTDWTTDADSPEFDDDSAE